MEQEEKAEEHAEKAEENAEQAEEKKDKEAVEAGMVLKNCLLVLLTLVSIPPLEIGLNRVDLSLSLIGRAAIGPPRC